jgi:hypothetical protein
MAMVVPGVLMTQVGIEWQLSLEAERRASAGERAEERSADRPGLLRRLFSSPGCAPMDDRGPRLLQAAGRHVGFSYRDGVDHRFVATDPRFGLLEGSRFRRPEQLQQAAEHLAAAWTDTAAFDAAA